MIAEEILSRKPQLTPVGGYLSTGETTLIGRMARVLGGRQVSSSVTTRDQVLGPMDKVQIQSSGYESVMDDCDCFCRRPEDLVKVPQDNRHMLLPLIQALGFPGGGKGINGIFKGLAPLYGSGVLPNGKADDGVVRKVLVS